MRELIGGALRTQAVYVIASLGIADHLALGPRHASELAARARVDADALRRLLRYLATRGVVVEREDGRFGLTAAGEYLQTAHPRSLRPSAVRAGEGFWRTVAGLRSTIENGVTAHEEVHGASFFEEMMRAGREAAFAARMSSSSAGLGDAIASHEAVARAATIVDVGGARGSLLTEVLTRRLELRGILFDTPPMIEVARQALATSPLAERITFAGGDFFESVPAADVYVLSWILHDWDDARAMRILRACREAGGESATLLIVELLLPERAQQLDEHAGPALVEPFLLDLQMLLLTGGRERTSTEYRSLLERAGFTLEAVSATESTRGASLLTARPAR